MTNINDILAKLSKDSLSKFRLGRDISKDFLPTASYGLDRKVGGLGVGKQSTFWGNESCGKSAFFLETAGINQKLGRGVGYFDVEGTFDPDWATRLGVDVDELLVAQVSSIGDYADLANDWIKAGVELIIVDSTSALMPKSFFDEGEMKSFDKTGQIGQFARELGQSSRMIQGSNYSAALVHISQVRMDLGNSFMPGMKPSGGKETGHADSLRIRMFSSKSEKQAIMGNVFYGDIPVQEQIGRKVTWTVDKNKVNGKYGQGEYDLYVLGNKVGIDRNGEVLDYAIKYGVVEKGGAWLTVEGERLQGRTKALDYLENNPEIVEKLIASIEEMAL